MQTKKNYILSILFVISDMFVINGSYIGALFCTEHFKWLELMRSDIMYLAVYNLLWIGTAAFWHLYDTNFLNNIEKVYLSSIKTTATVLVLFTLYIYFTSYKRVNASDLIVILLILLSILLLISRFVFTILHINVQDNISNKLNVAIVGSNATSGRVLKYFKSESHRYRLITLSQAGLTVEDYNSTTWYQEMVLIIKKANDLNVQELYLCLSFDKMEHCTALMAEAEAVYMRLSVIPDMDMGSSSDLDVKFVNDFPVFNLQPNHIIYMKSRAQKRCFDMIFSFFVLVFLLSWLYPLIALIIKLQSKGPVLFKQQRSGRNNKTFNCYKFRSMRLNDESDHRQASRNDERITYIGKILRKTSLDELPQFLNVLKGEMSIVGPRPHMLEHTSQYQVVIDSFMLRHSIKPGITGLAQIHGFRGQITANDQMVDRLSKDLEYIKEWSFMMDVRIIFITLFLSIRGQKNAF